MKAIVIPDLCIGCAMCTQICPEVFRMENDKAVAFLSPVPKDLEGKCREACDTCPVSAITIE